MEVPLTITAPYLLGLAGTIIILLLGVVAWFIRQDRASITEQAQHSQRQVNYKLQSLETDVNRVERDVHAIRESLPLMYVQKADWDQFRGWLTAMLTRVEDKLDRKRDKEDVND